MKKVLPILCGIVVCLAVGVLSSIIQADSLGSWYQTINRSPLNPPNVVFPIVWTILYLMMGTSVGILYNAEKSAVRTRMLWVFGIQLVLNYLWTFFFFYLQNPLLGLINLPVMIGLAIWYFCDGWKVKREISWLILPYVLWMCFATYLNLYVVLNN